MGFFIDGRYTVRDATAMRCGATTEAHRSGGGGGGGGRGGDTEPHRVRARHEGLRPGEGEAEQALVVQRQQWCMSRPRGKPEPGLADRFALCTRCPTHTMRQ